MKKREFETLYNNSMNQTKDSSAYFFTLMQNV